MKRACQDLSIDVRMASLAQWEVIKDSKLWFEYVYVYIFLFSAIPVVSGVLFIFVLSNLLKTSLTDPGIIPR